MSNRVLVLPVSVEQAAMAVRQMSRDEQARLLKLVPELREIVQRTPQPDETTPFLERLRAEFLQALGGQPLAPDEPFIGGLTLEQYLNLPEAERARLWATWEGDEGDLEAVAEWEARPDALPAR